MGKIGIMLKNDKGNIVHRAKIDKIVIKTYAVDGEEAKPLETFKLPHKSIKGIHIEELEEER